MALQHGHHETVTEFLAAVQDMAGAHRITGAQIVNLLRATRANGTPGLYMAQQHGHHKAVTAFLAGEQKMLKAGLIFRPTN